MASTKMFTKNHPPSSSFFHAQQQASSSSANQLIDEDVTLTQEMHVKMAKKIAQLTKVIYTLNTKADEHDTIVSKLKQAFEQEKTALANNTSSRIDELLHRVEKLSSIKQSQHAIYENKIQMLESDRQNQANELLRIQQSSVEREHEIAEDFRSKLSHIKREINQMKKVHDDRSAHLNQEHQDAIERLRDEHQLEFDKLKGDMRAAFDIESHAQKNFYVQTIEQLKREQHELLARVNTQQSTDHVLEEQYHRDKQQLEKQTRMLEEQIERVQEKSQAESLELNNQLDAQRSQYQQLHDDYEQYKSIFNAKSDHVTEMNEQLLKQRNDYEQLKQKFDKGNREMTTLTERFNRQASELENKLKLLREKETLNHQFEEELIKARQELQLTVDRLRKIEEDQHTQLTESESTTNYLERRIHELDKTIHQLTVEKQQIMVKYDRALTDLRETYENQVLLCKEEKKNELDRLTSHHQQLSREEQTRAQTILQSREQELRQKFEVDKAELLAQWNKKIEQSQAEQSQTKHKYDRLKEDRQRQIDELRHCLDEAKNASALTEKELRETQAIHQQYEEQLKKLNEDLERQSSAAEQVRVECDQLKKRCQELEAESSRDLKDSIEKISMDLNEKWSKKLKIDGEKIRSDTIQLKDDEKRLALDDLEKRRQKEASQAQHRIDGLQRQLNEIEGRLINEQEKSKEDSLSVLQNANEEKRRTINEFQMRIQDLTTQIQRLEGQGQEIMLQQKLQLEKDHINQINDLKSRHLEDIHGQQLAYSTHLETVRADHERVLAVETEKQNVQYQSNLEQLRKDLTRTHSNDVEERDRAHGKELAALRLQLDRALELSKIKEREADLRIEDLVSDVNSKQTRIDHSLREMSELEDQLEQLRHDADLRTKDVQRIRNDSQKEMKHREEKLRHDHGEKIHDLIKSHESEQKQLLDEFAKAHELLKTRVNELQLKLNEAEERYRNRESRNEDLELISTLQQTIASYQEQLKKIHDEKKYLKMELANRETNFNKVFANAPSSNIGVMNPFAYSTKFIPRNAEGSLSTRLKSQSPRPSKLEPIVNNGEIPHDLTLNSSKPLLPKRFVK